jgi:hypothetical protein
MTDTSKPVTRRTRTDTVFDKGKQRRVIIRVGRGDVVSFRLEGLQFWTDPVEIRNLFWPAMYRTANRIWHEKNEKRKQAGQRPLKKPKCLKS